MAEKKKCNCEGCQANGLYKDILNSFIGRNKVATVMATLQVLDILIDQIPDEFAEGAEKMGLKKPSRFSLLEERPVH